MTSTERLLELRNKIKLKKPNFIRQDAHKKSLGNKWRRPKGIQSKMRYGLKGYRRKRAIGFRAPKKVRGLDRIGLKSVLVYSINGLKEVSKEEGIVIAKGVGLRKRIEIIKKAKNKGINILNIKDVDSYLKKVEEKIKEREEKKEEKKVKKEEKVKKEGKKDLAEKIKSEEEKEKEEKEEKDKILTKKDSMG